jgi:alkylhydroperoxidase family enzyme
MQAPPRIAPAEEPLPPRVAAALRKLLPPDLPAPRLFLTIARNPDLFAFLHESGWLGPTGLLDRRVLPRRLRECIILRTCVAARNEYEFQLHVRTISQRMGLSPAQIDDVREPRPDDGLWTAGELAAMELVDGLVRHLAVSDETFARCRAVFDEATLIEITQIVGLYTGVAMQVALARPEFDRY